MSDYNYTDGKFGSKDLLPTGDPLKTVKGADFEEEFPAIETAVNSKMNMAGPTFTGVMTGVAINITGTLSAGLINGGTF